MAVGGTQLLPRVCALHCMWCRTHLESNCESHHHIFVSYWTYLCVLFIYYNCFMPLSILQVVPQRHYVLGLSVCLCGWCCGLRRHSLTGLQSTCCVTWDTLKSCCRSSSGSAVVVMEVSTAECIFISLRACGYLTDHVNSSKHKASVWSLPVHPSVCLTWLYCGSERHDAWVF